MSTHLGGSFDYDFTPMWFLIFLFGTYKNERWIHHFKMTKCTLFDIAHQVKPLIGKQNIKYRLTILIEIWITYTIYKLAQGVNNLLCSELFAFGQSIIYLVIHEVILMINVVFKNLNYWSNGSKMLTIMHEFKD
jgi:hypothetical protein